MRKKVVFAIEAFDSLFEEIRNIRRNPDKKVDDNDEKERDREPSHAIVETRFFFDEEHREYHITLRHSAMRAETRKRNFLMLRSF